jgi:hypothetical protein
MDKEIKTYSFVCYKILYSRTWIDFPYSKTTKPSSDVSVLVVESPPTRFKIDRSIWEGVMIPTIEEIQSLDQSLVSLSYIGGIVKKYMILSGRYPNL